MAGTKKNGTTQTTTEARTATAKAIVRNIGNHDLPAAIHAAEDAATPLHNGRVWTGFGLNIETVQHLAQDTFPSRPTLVNAFGGAYMVIHVNDSTVIPETTVTTTTSAAFRHSIGLVVAFAVFWGLLCRRADIAITPS